MSKLKNPIHALIFMVLPYVALQVLSLTNGMGRHLEDYTPLLAGMLPAAYCVYVWKKEELSTNDYLILLLLNAASCCLSIMTVFSFGSGVLIHYLALFVPMSFVTLQLAHQYKSGAKGIDYNQDAKAIIVSVVLLAISAIVGGIRAESFQIIFLMGLFLLCGYGFAVILVHLFTKVGASPDTGEAPKKSFWVHNAILGLVLPLLGLAVNYIPEVQVVEASPVLLFTVAILNGIFLCLPTPQKPYAHLLLFFARAAGYIYVLYFAVIFLPYIPLGVLALFVVVGILFLAPALLTIRQGQVLFEDFRLLNKTVGLWATLAALLLGFAVLPVGFVGLAKYDAANLSRAMAYINQPQAQERVSVSAVRRALTELSTRASRNNKDFIDALFDASSGMPLLTSAYQSLVVEKVGINTEEVDQLKSIFLRDFPADDFDKPERLDTGRESSKVKIKGAEVTSAFDEEAQAYRSWVHLTIENSGSANAEFVSTFDLPVGAFVTDYYLNVFGTDKEGMLVDARAALNLYSSIVRVNKDPGLLRYVDRNQLELRVFPFASDEVRTTGFELLHISPLSLNMNGTAIDIAVEERPELMKRAGTELIELNAQAKRAAKGREAEIFFVVDCTIPEETQDYLTRVEDFARDAGLDEAQVLLTTYGVKPTTLAQMHEAAKGVPTDSGLNANLAVLYAFETVQGGKYPVLIFASDNLRRAVLPEALAYTAERYPETDSYYFLSITGLLTRCTFEGNVPMEVNLTAPLAPRDTVVVDGEYYLSGQKGTVLKIGENQEFTGNLYTDAAILQRNYWRKVQHGGMDNFTQVKDSFRLGVLSPVTSYMVVETKEQEQQLLENQERLLKQDKNRAVSNGPKRASEPAVWLVAVVFLMGVAMMQLYKRKKVPSKGR